MKTRNVPPPAFDIEAAILTVRGQRVLLDTDLARVYEVPTRVLNQAVKRNRNRFPEDFLFQLTRKEMRTVFAIRSQNVIASRPPRGLTRSSHAASKRNLRYLPFAFTEHGAIMAANVLNSPRAVQMSVFVVRAFLKVRELLGGTKDLARQLRELEAKLTARLDGHETAIVDVLRRLMRLLDPPPQPEPPRRQIGFHVPPGALTTAATKARNR
jgi:hypothetical protein